MSKIVENGYFELVRRFRLRPIRTANELAQATEVIDGLIPRTFSAEEPTT